MVCVKDELNAGSGWKGLLCRGEEAGAECRTLWVAFPTTNMHLFPTLSFCAERRVVALEKQLKQIWQIPKPRGLGALHCIFNFNGVWVCFSHVAFLF